MLHKLRSSIALRLYVILLSAMVLTTFLGGYIYFLKTKNLVAYEQILSNISYVNSLPPKLSDTVSKLMRYHSAKSVELEQEITADINELLHSAKENMAICQSEACLHSAEGLYNITVNLQKSAIEVMGYSGQVDPPTPLYTTIDMLGVIADVFQTNVQRYISIELDYTTQLKQQVAEKNKDLHLLILLLSILIAALFVFAILLVKFSVISPLEHLKNALNQFRKSGKVELLAAKSNDEIGSLAKGFNAMVEAIGQREARAAESDNQYRQLFDNMQDGFAYHKIIVDQQGTPIDYRFLEVNEAFESLTGIRADQIKNKLATQVFPGFEQDTSSWVEEYGQVALTGKNISLDQYVPHLNRWYRVSAYSPEQGYFGCIFHDITEPLTAKKELQESEQRFRLLNESSITGVYLIQGDIFTYVNQAFSKMFGYEPDEIVDKIPVTDLVHPDDHPLVLDSIQRRLDKPEASIQYAFQGIKKDGSIVYIETYGRSIKYKGKPCIIGTLINNTEKEKAQLEQRRLETQLRQAQKMEAIGTLVGGIAHDFNNILSSIFGFAQLARNRIKDDEKTLKRLDSVLVAATRAKDLVQHLLTFSRKSEVEKMMLNLTPLIKETLKFTRATAPSTIEIHNNIGEEHQYVMADITQMHQVFMNLFTNAAQAMEQHGGLLTVNSESLLVGKGDGLLLKGLASGRYLNITVADTGTGIPKQHIDKIFDPFFTTKEKGEGTGLGLSVAYGIIKEMEGHIWVYSEAGQGTTFTIFLPEVSSGKEPSQNYAQDDASKTSGTGSIFLVDDEKDIITWMSEMLKDMGYTVAISNNPEQALKTFKAAPDAFDLIITDQTMPGMLGIELAQEIHALKPDLPIILNTGFAEGLDAVQLERCGIKKILMKPVIESELSETIETYIAKVN